MDVLREYLFEGSAKVLPTEDPYLEPGDTLVLQVTEGDAPRIVRWSEYARLWTSIHILYLLTASALGFMLSAFALPAPIRGFYNRGAADCAASDAY